MTFRKIISAAAYMFVLMVCSVLQANEPASVFTISPDSKPIIVIQDGMQQQAKILREYINKVSGIELEIVVDNAAVPGDKITIEVGNTRNTPVDLKKEIASMDRDGFIIQNDGKHLYLIGHDGYSTRFAVLEFLERACGIRWYMPTELGEVVPKLKEIEFSESKIKMEPAFKSRLFSGVNGIESSEWMVMNKQRARYKFHHNISNLLPASKYGEKYPEIYPFFDGKRQVPSGDSGDTMHIQVCFTNPKTVELVVKAVKGEKYASVAPNDGDGWCECPECLKWYDPADVRGDSPNETYVLTRYIFQFVNKVAKACPETVIGLNAYSYYREVTPDLKLQPNIIPYVVGMRDNAIEPKLMDWHVSMVKGWHDAGAAEVGIYEWYEGGGYNVPKIYNRVIGDFLSAAHKEGATALYAELYPNWAFDGPKYWLLTRLEWNPDIDVEAAIDEYYEKFFMESGEPMKAYFTKLEKVWLGGVISGESGGLWDSECLRPFTEAVLKKLDKSLSKAEELAQQELVKKRIKYFRKAFVVYSTLAKQFRVANSASRYLESPDTISKSFEVLEEQAIDMANYSEAFNDLVAQEPYGLNPRITLSPTFNRANGKYLGVMAKIAGLITEDIVGSLKSKKITERNISKAFDKSLAKYYSSETEKGKALVKNLAEISNRIAVAKKVNKAPVLDGKLDDSCWKQAASYGNFGGYGVWKTAKYNTVWKAVYKDDILYMAVDCKQDMTAPIARSPKRDGPAWWDDSVEIFINKLSPENDKDYFQTIITTKGSVFDWYKKVKTWNEIQQFKTFKYESGWSFEVAIPLGKIDMVKDRVLKINFVRNVQPSKHNMNERTTWFPTWDANNDFISRGYLFLR